MSLPFYVISTIMIELLHVVWLLGSNHTLNQSVAVMQNFWKRRRSLLQQKSVSVWQTFVSSGKIEVQLQVSYHSIMALAGC